jgi:hypothetical protein
MAARTPWGRRLQSLVSAGGSVAGGLDCPLTVEDEVRKVFVLMARCRGAIGA